MSEFNKEQTERKLFTKEDWGYFAIGAVATLAGAAIGSYIGFGVGWRKCNDAAAKNLKKLWAVSPGLKESMLNAAVLVDMKNASNI